MSKNTETDIITMEEMVLKGLAHRFKKFFDLPYPVVFVSGGDKLVSLQALRKQLNCGADYPHTMMKIQSWEVRTEGYNPKSLFRQGVMTINDTDDEYTKVEPIPVNMTVEISCFTDNFDFTKKYCNRWLYAAVSKPLNMEVTFMNKSYGIQIELDSNIAQPEADRAAETVNHYELISTMIIRGYITPQKPLSEFPKVAAVREINGRMFMVTDTDESTAEEIPDLIATSATDTGE